MPYTSKEIAARIIAMAQIKLDGPTIHHHRALGATALTIHIMNVFGTLGAELEYMVTANHFPGQHGPEWRYDMEWTIPYHHNGYGAVLGFGEMLYQQAMALESEQNPGNGLPGVALVDPDFLKLVIGRAQVRVWFALIHTDELAQRHLRNCKRQAQFFAGSMPEDTYVFILYSWETGTVISESWQVGL